MAKSTRLPKERSLWRWLTHEKVLIIVLGVMIGDAVSRVVMRFIEQVFTPLVQSTLQVDPSNATYVQIGSARIQARAFVVSLFEFGLVILIAFLISKQY